MQGKVVLMDMHRLRKNHLVYMHVQFLFPLMSYSDRLLQKELQRCFKEMLLIGISSQRKKLRMRTF